MKHLANRTNLIVVSLSLCLGIPGQAQTKKDGCDGRNMTHRKHDDLASDITFLLAKLGIIGRHNETCVTTAKAQKADRATSKSFVALTSPSAKPEVVIPEAPEVQGLLAVLDMKVDAIPTALTGVNAPAVVLAQTETPAPEVAAVVDPKSTKKYRHYELTLAITKEAAAANGIVTGTFPALLLENQQKTGVYGKKMKAVATVSETETGFVNRVSFERMPVKNSTLVIDFKTGHAAPITLTSDMLAKMTGSDATPTSAKLKGKAYADLNSAVPVKTGFAKKTVALMMPLAPGIVTMNPFLVGFEAVSVGRQIVTDKYFGNNRAMAALQHPSLVIDRQVEQQNDQIELMNGKLILMQQQIDSLKTLLQLATSQQPQPQTGDIR